MRLEDYLARAEFRGEIAPTLQVLTDLLRAHVTHIPFENLDIQLGRTLTTEPESAFDKIVTRKRGGWCYEQNGLFGWALSEIGFEVTRVAAAVMRSERDRIADANHLTLLVRTKDSGHTWLADVGFGGSMIAPIELRESAHKHNPFRLGLRRTDGHRWQFWEDIGDGEFTFDFFAEPADETALADKCQYLQTSPESGFVQSLVAQIRLPDAHKTLRGKVFSQASAGGIGTRILESPDELVSVLSDIFGIDVPEAAGLWPRIEQRHEELLREKALTNTYEIRSRSHNQSLG